MFREQSEELLSDVSFHVLAAWRIKPHDVSFPFSLARAWDINILQKYVLTQYQHDVNILLAF